MSNWPIIFFVFFWKRLFAQLLSRCPHPFIRRQEAHLCEPPARPFSYRLKDVFGLLDEVHEHGPVPHHSVHVVQSEQRARGRRRHCHRGRLGAVAVVGIVTGGAWVRDNLDDRRLSLLYWMLAVLNMLNFVGVPLLHEPARVQALGARRGGHGYHAGRGADES